MKEMIKKGKIMLFAVPVLIAAILSAIYLSGITDMFSWQLADRIYQRGNLPSGRVFVIGIDSHSMDELGPYQTWTRDYIAQAVETLFADPENAPAVVALDILYIGETTPESDAHLADACSMGTVVTGSYANIESTMVERGIDSYAMSDRIVLYEEPYEALGEATTSGFVNGFTDKDGFVRHGMQRMDLSESERINSFSYEIYKAYAQSRGFSGELSIPERNGYWYIPFIGKSGTYNNGYSVSDLIQGEISTERFKDAIVIIGPYAEGMMDSYRTAIDPDHTTYGVEIHANMVEIMLDGDFKRELPAIFQIILIFIATLAAFYICNRKSMIPVGIMVLIGGPGYLLLAFLLYQLGLVLDVLYVPAICTCFAIYSIGLHYLTAHRMKKEVETMFKRYVAPEIVDKITKTGLEQIKLGGDTMDIACLFVDIRGFTTMSEVLTPELVVEILNQYLEFTSECIFKHGGTLDKFVGDCTMALFNVPLEQEDYIYHAVLAAWDMVQEAKPLSENLLKQYGRSVQFGVGVHCGKAVVGNIGSKKRMDYTAIGDTVNTAARLEANAPAGTVYISRDVADILGDRIKISSLGNLPLKGKSQELEVFKLEGIN